MAYEIPPPLQHKEKIIFGLTFEQLIYAAPAFLLCFVLFFKTGWPMEITGTLCILVVFTAAFFMFFDGLQRMKNWFNFVRNPQIKSMSSVLKKIIDVKKVDSNFVYHGKTRLAVLEVTPMNFMLRNEDEQEAIIAGFTKFLNSLEFPIQVHVTSKNVDLTEHHEFVSKNIKNRVNELKVEGLNEISNSYSTFIEGITTGKNLLNRKFYLLLGENDDLNMQVAVCTERISALGLRVRQLQNEQLVTFLHEELTNGAQKDFEGGVDDLGHYLYSPSKVSFHSDYFEVDDMFYRVVTITGYPQSVEMGFLDKIISLRENFDVNIHIHPQSIDETMVWLNRDLQKQQADLFSDSSKGILNPSLEIKYQSTKKILEDLQKGRQKLFNVSVYVTCKGNTKDEVCLLSKRVKAELEGLMLQSRVPTFQSMEGYGSVLPLGKDLLSIQRNVHTQGLAAFFPFSSPFLDADKDGVFIGLNKNQLPVIKNVFGLTNANGVILATSGAGKSYFTKLFLSRNFMNGSDVIIIDPQSEYQALTQKFGGENITISRESPTIINPLDLMGHDYMEKRLTLMDVFQIMFGDLNELQKSILDNAIDLTYENCGITPHDFKSHEPPILGDLLHTLETLEGKAQRLEKVTYRALINRLRMYTAKGVFGFMDRQTSINFDNPFVCFNIGKMPKQAKPLVMYLILDYVYMRMKGDKRKKILVIDEAWSLLQNAKESSYVFEIVKTCRKYNLGLLLITQDVADLVASPAGRAVLSNTSYTFLLRQKPSVIPGLQKAFNLGAMEKDYLLSAPVGRGIVIMENERQELEVIASDDEHKLITTNPNEIIESEVKKPSKKLIKEKANLDLSKHVIFGKNLTTLQINTLNNHGYVLKKFHNLESGPLPYYVKPAPPESIDHTFLVTIIANEIRKYTDKVWIKKTVEPDIIFENKSGLKIALEIETGKYLINHRKRINEKFEKFKKQFGDRGILVLTDTNLKNSYKRYKVPILLRREIKEFIQGMFPLQ